MTIRRYNVFMSGTQDSPFYSRVETALASEIADGDLEVGDQLPTEGSLISRFGVSRITVRRAIQNLVSRGLVEIHRGKGTFVAAPKITQNLAELSGFVEDMHALGRKPTTRVIGKEVVTADATVASRLALTRGQRVRLTFICALLPERSRNSRRNLSANANGHPWPGIFPPEP
jgi:GntR family transcriptional regulator